MEGKECTENTLTFSNTLTEAPYHDYGWHFTSDGGRKDILICDSDASKTPLYVARMTASVTKKKPDVRLYSVQGISVDPEVTTDGKKLKSKQAKVGDILAVAYFPAFSKKIQMGFGSPDRPEDVQWETLKTPKISVWEFSMASPAPDKQYSNAFSNNLDAAGSVPKDQRMYQWKNTHTAVDGMGKATEARRKLVNDKGEIVALFVPKRPMCCWTTGTLRIFKEHLGATSNTLTGIGKEMEIRVILTRCAIREKLRR